MKNKRKDLDLSERVLEVKTKSTKLRESLLDKKDEPKNVYVANRMLEKWSWVDTHKNLQSIIQEDGELRVRETAYLNKIEQLSEKNEILYYKALFKKLRSSEEGNSLFCRRLKSCQ
ncbi:unnamed protein product [Arabidopsis halleri]